MKLSVLDRFAVLGSLPQHGSYLTMAVAAEIRDRVKVSPTEAEALKLKPNADGTLQWQESADSGLEVEFSKAETELIVERLADMDKNGKLTTDHIGIYRRFIQGKDILDGNEAEAEA